MVWSVYPQVFFYPLLICCVNLSSCVIHVWVVFCVQGGLGPQEQVLSMLTAQALLA